MRNPFSRVTVGRTSKAAIPCDGDEGPPETLSLAGDGVADDVVCRPARLTPGLPCTSYADTMPPISTETRLCACARAGLNTTMTKAVATTTQDFMGPS